MTIVPRLDSPGCGCDAISHVKGLISIDAALRVIGQTAHTVTGVETVTLAAAKGRVLAEPVRARANVPPFDNSAMDGYAIAARCLTGDGPWHLTVTERIAAGDSGCDTGRAIGPRHAARIFTGAPIPAGTDAVVMQEEVHRAGDRVTLTRRPATGQNIRRAGEDMCQGTEALARGRRIGAREIAVCAAAGQATVDIRRAVRVALMVTGDEVRQAGQGLAAAQIWDINTPALSATLSGANIDLVEVAHGADTPLALRAQLARLATAADLIVTTGGISVGEEDHVKPAITALGGDIQFSGVAIKPGKPVSFGTLGKALWLGLPGNPVSALVTWQVFGAAILRQLGGETGPRGTRRHVVLGHALHHTPGRCELRPARLAGYDALGREVAFCDDATHSARVAGLPQADGLLLIPSDTKTLPQGSLLEFQSFDTA